MKLGKIFICINLLILSLLMLTKRESWPRIVYQPSYWKFDNHIVDINDGYILKDRIIVLLYHAVVAES